MVWYPHYLCFHWNYILSSVKEASFSHEFYVMTIPNSLHACMLGCFCHVGLFTTPWTIAHQAPLSRGFSRQEYWRGLPYPPPGDLPDPGIEPTSLRSPALADGFFITNAIWEALTKLFTFCQTQLKDFCSFVAFHRIYFLPKIPLFLSTFSYRFSTFIIQHSDFFCECLWLFQTDLFWLILSIFNWNSALNSIDRLTFSLLITLFICLSHWFVNSIKARTHITFWNQPYLLTASPLNDHRDPHQSHSILTL